MPHYNVLVADPIAEKGIEELQMDPSITVDINLGENNKGLKESELIALAWEDIDLKTGTVKVCRARVNGSYKQTKTKRSTREVELIDPAIQWLQVQRLFTERLDTRRLKIMSRDNKKQFFEDVRLVFLNSNTKRPHESDGTVRNNFWRAHLKKAQVRYRGPNTARHTFISQLLTAGIAKE
ncbi:MAG TPA: tyrosine-type recombinase/integrase, partial [Verrucomicrobiales bacterium]|nr:tyrosine-type recombinase/integrase [Verrucomicrobiales bacterium]